MFSLFTHKNNQRHHKQNGQENKLAENIVYRCIKVQIKTSKFLQKKSEMLPLKVKRLIVIVFCLISFGSCIYVLTNSFYRHPEKLLSIARIEVSRQTESINQKPSLSKEEFEKIQKFRSYLDSLIQSKPGKRIHDSIIAHRPGLIDSLSIVENLYQSQLLNR
jgi:hypothetical protein